MEAHEAQSQLQLAFNTPFERQKPMSSAALSHNGVMILSSISCSAIAEESLRKALRCVELDIPIDPDDAGNVGNMNFLLNYSGLLSHT